jgi:hypothetical protein
MPQGRKPPIINSLVYRSVQRSLHIQYVTVLHASPKSSEQRGAGCEALKAGAV